MRPTRFVCPKFTYLMLLAIVSLRLLESTMALCRLSELLQQRRAFQDVNK